MKICLECNTANSDSNNFCFQCGELLNTKSDTNINTNLDNATTNQNDCNVSESLNSFNKFKKTYNDIDNSSCYENTIPIEKIDIITGCTAIAFIIINFLNMSIKNPLDNSMDHALFLFTNLTACGYVIAYSFFANIIWHFFKFGHRYSIDNIEDATPGIFYTKYRRYSNFILLTIACITTIVSTVNAFYVVDVDKYNVEIEQNITTIFNDPNAANYDDVHDYINANLNLWRKIINKKEYTVDLFLKNLKESNQDHMKEMLMIEAIIQIKKPSIQFPYKNKREFLFAYDLFIN